MAYGSLGQYEKAVETTRKSLELYPENVTAYENLGTFYLPLNRLTEAKDITNQALARKLDEEMLHTNLYSLAFLQGDSAEMIKQAAWFEGKPTSRTRSSDKNQAQKPITGDSRKLEN